MSPSSSRDSNLEVVPSSLNQFLDPYFLVKPGGCYHKVLYIVRFPLFGFPASRGTHGPPASHWSCTAYRWLGLWKSIQSVIGDTLRNLRITHSKYTFQTLLASPLHRTCMHVTLYPYCIWFLRDFRSCAINMVVVGPWPKAIWLVFTLPLKYVSAKQPCNCNQMVHI